MKVVRCIKDFQKKKKSAKNVQTVCVLRPEAGTWIFSAPASRSSRRLLRNIIGEK